MKLKPLAWAMTWGLAAVLAQPAVASLGNAPSSYGLLPSDVGSAQSLSIFNDRISAVYYNPANLVRDRRGELTGGVFHADHDLKTNGDRIMNTPSQQLQLGLKTDLSNLSTLDHPLYFGMMVGVEKFAKEMMAFSSSTSNSPQYLTYGRQPLFLTAGVGTSVWRGIDVGFSLRVTLHASATLNTDTTLAGHTSNEELDVSAKPVFRPIVGLNIRWGETFCGKSDCWMDNLETAIAYRAYSNARTKVNSNVSVPGVIVPPGLNLAIQTFDSFQPEITTLGVKYDFGQFRLGVTGEYQAWGRLQRELRDDTIKDQAHANFRDIVIPRVGVEFDLGDHLTFTAGVAHERSPLESKRTVGVNYVDADKTVFGLGLTAVIPKMPMLAYPVRMDLGYQHQRIDKRTFEVVDGNGLYLGDAKTEGSVNVFSTSVTLRF
ncbi:OmpP1/FadL family transporter [Isoalcanivorax beigongshangi]|uniref:OmpP1/FadL family transporter n=1 Tax=Isoalcanivorax beigongshangi TaxID=3238810 RepID=A0ABV4AF27_9GAMM